MEKTISKIAEIEYTLTLLSKKWTVLIICNLLEKKTLRQCDFKKILPSISQRMLTKQLRFLEEKDIIVRQIYSEIPPKVTYSLTELGLTLEDPILALSKWGNKAIK